MEILEVIFAFFRDNPLLAVLVIAGIAQSLGSAASTRKRERPTPRRSPPEIQFDPPEDRDEDPFATPTPVVQESRTDSTDDLSRRIREMLEESRTAEQQSAGSLRSNVRPAPPPVPPIVEEPSYDYEDFDAVEETRSVFAETGADSHEIEHLPDSHLPSTGTETGMRADSVNNWGQSEARESVTSLLSGPASASLPGSIDPRLAMFASVVLGPPRAFRSLEDERPS